MPAPAGCGRSWLATEVMNLKSEVYICSPVVVTVISISGFKDSRQEEEERASNRGLLSGMEGMWMWQPTDHRRLFVTKLRLK